MPAASAALHARVIHYRDDSGRVRSVRIESTDPAEVDRIAAAYRALERASDKAEQRWAARNTTFTDAGVRDAVSKPVGGDVKGGYPWEGPRFEFPLLLGESPTWSGPDSLLLRKSGQKRKACRFCGHYPNGLPDTAYCLGCDRSGMDPLIEKGKPRTRTKLPPKGALKGGKS